MKRTFRIFTALLLCVGLLGALLLPAGALPSDEIQDELDRLKKEADDLAAEQEKLAAELSSVSEQLSDYAQLKLDLDRELELKRQEVENLEAQLHQYNLLISEKQAELDELLEQQKALIERYKLRMRAVQERGDISFWSVLLSSSSFTELLTSQAMVEEISRADLQMLSALADMASEVLAAKEDLAEKKTELAGTREQLDAAQAALVQSRADADAMLTSLANDREKLRAAELQAEAEVAALSDQIAKKEQELTEAKKKEQPQPTEKGFLFPVATSGFACVTDPYGYRTNPITGNYQLHNGIDLAANRGTPIYAAKTGTVSTAASGYGWGNYVVINHGDGYSTLYAHQDYYIVSEGDTVTQGQVIGYVGSTGNSTGPHLHFTIYYNGSTVNPAGYIAIP